eukprot:TRINITY_DN4207_c0_g1_i2.p2 TRINITY_DN4207_c0_g1~~TRINITY_DN4207_c0_g1_i2.p2  ORF type:complete len:134 (-),score=15.98 TRINITY_DN4207_c0_g1_i2:330-731(-)
MSRMLTAFGRMFEPFLQSWSKSYQKEVGAELAKYGLRVDDLLDPDSHPDIEEALRRTPQEVLDARMQRQKRAMDLSMKHTSMPKELLERQTPFEFYLQDTLKRVQAEEGERYDAGAPRSKDREIPQARMYRRH